MTYAYPAEVLVSKKASQVAFPSHPVLAACAAEAIQYSQSNTVTIDTVNTNDCTIKPTPITCAAESLRYSGGTLAMRNGRLPVDAQRVIAGKHERVSHAVR